MLLFVRVRKVLVPLALYCAAAAASSYFIWHAANGQRGIKTGLEYEKQIAELQQELDRLRGELTRWSHRIALVRGDSIDRDILDEEARLILGRAHKYDVIILDPEKGRDRGAPKS